MQRQAEDGGMQMRLGKRAVGAVVVLALCAVAGLALASNHGRWEFKVCAEPLNYPASSRDQSGYENQIVRILADELGAYVTFVWTVFDTEALERTLHAGLCDAVVGIQDGLTGVESTIPFLRVPYTFVSLAGEDVDVASLDDPQLEELTIGTYPGGVPSLALRRRGLQENVREYAPVPAPDGFDREKAILDALIGGEVDIAVVFGPAAAARAEAVPGLLDVRPVTPEMDVGAQLLQMFRTYTIGVRPNDVDFREQLDFAMAARWDEIQAAIAEYGVPQLDITQPRFPTEMDSPPLSIGLVLPMATAAVHEHETVGVAAHNGAEYARNAIARGSGAADVSFAVRIASAPSNDAAIRAAERLAAVEGVFALGGGFGLAQAVALSRVAEEHDLVFFNIGSSHVALRGELCSRASFHVVADTAMYVDAAITWYATDRPEDWYVVYEATPDGEAFANRVRSTLTERSPEDRLVGSSMVSPDQLVYLDEIMAIHEAGPDIVLVGLGEQASLMFHGQLEGRGTTAVVAPVPRVGTQHRQFLYRLGQAAPSTATAPRPALWEASVETGQAGEMN